METLLGRVIGSQLAQQIAGPYLRPRLIRGSGGGIFVLHVWIVGRRLGIRTTALGDPASWGAKS